jgi:modulator of FtsH protease HflK
MTEQQNNPEEQSIPQNGSQPLSSDDAQASDAQAAAAQTEISPASSVAVERERLDPANQALADALRISFMILKLVIIFVVGLFIAGGFYQVEQNQRAVELLFGRVQGVGREAIAEPGWHWVWPYVGEVILIPAPTAVQTLDVDSFWYYMTEKEKTLGKVTRVEKTLQIVRDGYSLTSTRRADRAMLRDVSDGSGLDGGERELSVTDYNLVHTKWRIEYYVTDPITFVRNLWDGKKQGWFVVERLLRSVLSDAVINVSAHRDIDWILWQNTNQFTNDVEVRMTARLNAIDVGLTAKLILIDKSTPHQVRQAFDRATSARSTKNAMLNTAEAQANEIINEAEAQQKIIVADAKAYVKTIVNSARADAAYIDEVLGKINSKTQERFPGNIPDYQARRKQAFNDLLNETVDQLYQETLREVMAGADETIVLPVTAGKPKEVRIQISRDPTIERQKRQK